MGRKLGLDCKAYRNTGTHASPTWDEMILVQDVNIELDKDTTDTSIRGSSWELLVGTLKKASLEIVMLYDTADLDFTAILTAFLANTQIEFAFMDGPIATVGSQGLWAICDVVKMSAPQKLKEANVVTFSVVPTYNTAGTSGAFVPPEWKTIAA